MTTTQQPSATLYILIPPCPLFAAHWSLFIHDPLNTDTRTESDQGRRIHVSGDRLNGFHLEIIRNYNVRQHRGVGSRRFAIGRVITNPHPSQVVGKRKMRMRVVDLSTMCLAMRWRRCAWVLRRRDRV